MTLDIRLFFLGVVLGASLATAPRAMAAIAVPIVAPSTHAGSPNPILAIRLGFDDAPSSGSSAQPPADGPSNGGAPLSGAQLTQQYAGLSPELHAAVTDLLKSKGADALSSMSEGDARSTFETLPAGVKAELQAKWDALSDEQRIALKKLGPAAIKQMLAAQMSQMVQRTMAPVMKPVEDAVAGTQAAVEKTGSFLRRGREAVQRWISRFRDNHDSNNTQQAE